MAFTAKDERQQRYAMRRPVSIAATLRDAERRPFDVAVADLSETGFRVPALADLSPGAIITLGMAGLGMRPARVVWRNADAYGCAFIDPITPLAVDQAADQAAATIIIHPRQLPSIGFDALPAGPVAEPTAMSVAWRTIIVLGMGGAAWMALKLMAGAIAPLVALID